VYSITYILFGFYTLFFSSCAPRPGILRQELLNHTDLEADVVRLNSNLGHLAVLGGDRVALAADIAEDGCSVKVNIKRLGELGLRVGEEANLSESVLLAWPGLEQDQRWVSPSKREWPAQYTVTSPVFLSYRHRRHGTDVTKWNTYT